MFSANGIDGVENGFGEFPAVVAEVKAVRWAKFMQLQGDLPQIGGFVVDADLQSRAQRTDCVTGTLDGIRFSALDVHLDEGRANVPELTEVIKGGQVNC